MIFDCSENIIYVAFLRGLGKAPTFLVPIINPPFADNSPQLLSKKISQQNLLLILTRHFIIKVLLLIFPAKPKGIILIAIREI